MYARRRARRRATLEKKGGEARNREREERKMERIGKGRREWRERGGGGAWGTNSCKRGRERSLLGAEPPIVFAIRRLVRQRTLLPRRNLHDNVYTRRIDYFGGHIKQPGWFFFAPGFRETSSSTFGVWCLIGHDEGVVTYASPSDRFPRENESVPDFEIPVKYDFPFDVFVVSRLRNSPTAVVPFHPSLSPSVPPVCS